MKRTVRLNWRSATNARLRLLLVSLLLLLAVVGLVSSTHGAFAQGERPDAPTGLTVSGGDSDGELAVSWDAHPDGAEDYRLSWAPDGESFRTWTDGDWNAFPTSAAHTITGLDAGEAYKVKVRARFDSGRSSLWSGVVTANAAGTPENSAPTGLPVITGTAQVDETLSADTSGIADANGLSNPGFTYQWVRSSGGTDADISGATGATYTLTGDDAGNAIRVRVSFTDDDGYSETLTSAATDTVVPPPNVPATGQPTITGTVEVGETLSADISGISDANGLSNPGFTHQWVGSSGGTDTDILGATGQKYTLTSDDQGNTVKVTVSFTDDDGYAESLTSAPTNSVAVPISPRTTHDVVPAAPANLAWTGSDGSSLTFGWDDPSDTSITHYDYRIIKKGGLSWDPDWTQIPGSSATTTTFTVTGLDGDTEYNFELRAVNSSGNGTAARYEEAYTDIAYLPAPTNLQATPEDGEVILTWDLPAPPPYYNASYVSYSYYVWDSNFDDFVGRTTIPGSDLATERFTVTGLANGEEYWFFVYPNRTVPGIQQEAWKTATPGVNPVAVKNLDQTSDGNSSVGNTGGTNENAQGFVTGVSALRFLLDTVTVDVHTAATSSTTYSAEIWSATSSVDSDGLPSPDTLVVTLTGGDITNTGEVEFEAPDDTLLDSNTTYFVVLSATGGDAASAYKVATTSSTYEDATPKAGWSILDKRHVKGTSWATQAGVIRLSVEVTRVPLPAEPANVQAMPRHKKITLLWDNPNDDSITKYQYRVKENPFEDIPLWDIYWTDIPGSGPDTVSHTVDDFYGVNLVNGREYAFQVRAWNSSGEGPPSARVDASPRAAELVLSNASLHIVENNSGTFTVKLSTQPTANVRVAVSSDDTGVATVSNSSLTFTVNNWDTEQTVSVNGVNDADSANETARVSLDASGGDYGGVTEEVEVTVYDDEIPSLVLSDTYLRLGEDGSDTFSVRLAIRPSADVTVAVASDDTGAATVSHSSLTFTTTNWIVGQTVRVNGVDDDDNRDEAVQISLSASGGGYGAVSRLVTVFVTDDEAAPEPSGRTVRFGASSYTAVEGGSTANITVEMSPAPTSPTTITLTKEHLGGATASDYLGIPSTLVFSPGQTSRSFTVTAADDSTDDDGEIVLIGFGTQPSGIVEGSPATAEVHFTDNDNRSLPDIVPANTGTSATIDVGRSWVNGNPVKGSIEHQGDVDWYKTQLTAGHCYQIDIWGKTMVEEGYAEGLNLVDPMLKGVYRHDGVFLRKTRNDDGRGDNRTVRHTLKFSKSGTFYIAATHEWNRYEGGGTFELSLIDLGTIPTCTEVDVDNDTRGGS